MCAPLAFKTVDMNLVSWSFHYSNSTLTEQIFVTLDIV